MGDPTIDHHIFLSIPLSQDLESDIIFINGRPSFIHLVTHSFIPHSLPAHVSGNSFFLQEGKGPHLEARDILRPRKDEVGKTLDSQAGGHGFCFCNQLNYDLRVAPPGPEWPHL